MTATRAGRFVERHGVRTAFGWGFAEATLFFFLPDIAVGAVALFGLRRGLRAAAAAVGGAVLGGATMWVAARWAGPGIRDVLDALPAIPADFFTRVRADIADLGGRAVIAGPGRGIPYKLYAAEWALGGHSLPALLAWTVPARAIRICGTAVVAWAGGRVFRRLFGDREGLLLAAYAVAWTAVYAVYFAKVGLY